MEVQNYLAEKGWQFKKARDQFCVQVCPLCGDELVGFNTETLNQRFKQHARNRHKKEYAQIRREID